MLLGSSLSAKINDRMRILWRDRSAPKPLSGPLHSIIYSFRTSLIYQTILRLMKRHVLPLFLAIVMVWFAATLVSHFLFNAADSIGAFCKGTPMENLTPVNTGVDQAGNSFETKAICAPTGLKVFAGRSYQITISVTEPWEDAGRPVTPAGFRTSTIELANRWKFRTAIFLRRILFRPWYRIIARVGEAGVDEYFLDPIPLPNTTPQAYKATFKASRSGELFLYVNDVVIGLPWVYDAFYSNNGGNATVKVKLL